MRRTDLDYYRELYQTMKVLPQWRGTVQWYANKATKGQAKYSESSLLVYKKLGLVVPWQVTAAIHLLEASGDFTRQILNGEIYTRRTRLVPKGLGPWETWSDATVDAYKHERWKGINFNDIGDVLYHLEKYNGLGYSRKNKNSPYLWSFSNHGVGVGKYVADGKYSASAVSKQAGAAIILKELGFSAESEIKFCKCCGQKIA
jgi:lysozyme family protein